jgi:hypothetical protein
MTKYLLTDWEVNGYNDSDFVCTYFDTVDGKVHTHTYGSTRYPSATNIGWNNGVSSVVIDGEACLYPTIEVVELARVWLEEYIFQRMLAADKLAVDEPQVKDLHEGLQVQVKEACRFQLTITEPCNKCSGSGKWINPHRPTDERACFGCKGTGKHFAGKAKDAAGKLVYVKLEVGTSGSVIDWASFGKFYANGYNHPGPSNTTVQFRLESGNVVRAGLSKLRLHRNYREEKWLHEKARECSYSYQFSAIYPRHAWDSSNFAHAVASLRPTQVLTGMTYDDSQAALAQV